MVHGAANRLFSKSYSGVVNGAAYRKFYKVVLGCGSGTIMELHAEKFVQLGRGRITNIERHIEYFPHPIEAWYLYMKLQTEYFLKSYTGVLVKRTWTCITQTFKLLFERGICMNMVLHTEFFQSLLRIGSGTWS